mmetsp:Transcript_3139/g.8003  ORF Transcript_3139/g.8003 Transcript_3139/m.8003 type:complete len:94 (+) Transcript_3139:3256-3537(+)
MQFGLIGDGYYSHVGDLQKNHHLHPVVQASPLGHTMPRALFEYNERASALAVRERFPIVDPPFSLKQATSASAGSLPQKNGIILYRVNGKFFQ